MKERILMVRASLPSHLLTGFDSTVAGKKTIIVAYCGANASFGIGQRPAGRTRLVQKLKVCTGSILRLVDLHIRS